MADTVVVEFTKAEALVLFEFTSRYSDSDKLSIEDQAEQRALWNLCRLFESALVEPFHHNYGEILKQARDSLRDATD